MIQLCDWFKALITVTLVRLRHCQNQALSDSSIVVSGNTVPDTAWADPFLKQFNNNMNLYILATEVFIHKQNYIQYNFL